MSYHGIWQGRPTDNVSVCSRNLRILDPIRGSPYFEHWTASRSALGPTPRLLRRLIPRYGSDGKFPFNYEDSTKATNKTGAATMMGPGDLFFTDGVMKNRFKFLGSEVRKELNPKINIEMDVTFVRIEDQRPNKKGTTYEFPAPLNEQRKNEHVKYDRTAVFSLEALGYAGKEFKVEENTTFSLPPDGARKNYLLQEVTPDSVTVEFTPAEGDKETVVIKKGSMPPTKE